MRSFGGGGRASEWCGWKVLSRVCAEPNALRCSTAWRGEGEEAGQPPRTRTDIRTHSETCGPRAAAGTPSSRPLTRDAEGHPLSSRASVHGAAGARRDGGLQRLLVRDSAWQGDGVGRVKARVWLCAQSVRCAYVSIIDFFSSPVDVLARPLLPQSPPLSLSLTVSTSPSPPYKKWKTHSTALSASTSAQPTREPLSPSPSPWAPSSRLSFLWDPPLISAFSPQLRGCMAERPCRDHRQRPSVFFFTFRLALFFFASAMLNVCASCRG